MVAATPPRIGFVGFGEFSQVFARGLRPEGVTEMWAYCAGNTHRPPYDPSFRAAARDMGVTLVATLGDLCDRTDLVFSAVTVPSALGVAEQLARELGPRHLLVDVNASTPGVKERTAAMVQARGAGYVDAAIMGAVSIYGHRVSIFASGPQAGSFQAAMAPYGLQINVVGDRPGMAAAIKTVRSVVTKGIAELLAEAMLAADRAGIAEAAFKGICDPMDATSFSAFAVMCITTDAIHAERRAAEMDGVVETMQELGVGPWMTMATRNRLLWTAASGVRGHFGGQVPRDWRQVLRYYRDLDAGGQA